MKRAEPWFTTDATMVEAATVEDFHMLEVRITSATLFSRSKDGVNNKAHHSLLLPCAYCYS